MTHFDPAVLFSLGVILSSTASITAAARKRAETPLRPTMNVRFRQQLSLSHWLGCGGFVPEQVDRSHFATEMNEGRLPGSSIFPLNGLDWAGDDA
jgi:hypothetical protein